MTGKSGKSVIKTLEANGWEKLRQSGSHVQMGKDGKRTTVPKHDELKKGTLAKIQRDTGIKF